jgi:hypothetical protein
MISKGSGITAGLEIWALTTAKKHVYVLFDRSPDGRYATDVDEWNSIVQDLNPQQSRTYVSHNQFKDVDDPYGILTSMLTEDACLFYRQNGVPDHRITFKRGDICFVMRSIYKKEKLANNTRVIIIEVYDRIIKVRTIEDYPRDFIVPRIRFLIKLKFGGFTLIRTQFPLRLAYAMTKKRKRNKHYHRCVILHIYV